MRQDLEFYKKGHFFPRFIVSKAVGPFKSQESLRGAEAAQSSGSGSLASSDGLAKPSAKFIEGLLEDFIKAQETSQEKDCLNFLCFEAFVQEAVAQTLLEKLSQAIGFQSYKIYEFPEVSSLEILEKLKVQLQEKFLQDKFIIFHSQFQKTEGMQGSGQAKSNVTFTYALKDLSQNQTFKKDLWLHLKKNL